MGQTTLAGTPQTLETSLPALHSLNKRAAQKLGLSPKQIRGTSEESSSVEHTHYLANPAFVSV